MVKMRNLSTSTLITVQLKIKAMLRFSTSCGVLWPKNRSQSSMLVGHIKFSPDRFFGLFKKTYRRSSVSTVAEVAQVVEVNTCRAKHTPVGERWRRRTASYLSQVDGISHPVFFVPYLTFSHTTSLGSHLLNRGWCTFASIVIQMKRRSTFWRASTAIFLVFQTKSYLPDLTSTGSGIYMNMYDHTVKALLQQILPVQSHHSQSHHSISHHKVGPPLPLKMRQTSLQQSGVYVASVVNQDTIRSPAQLTFFFNIGIVLLVYCIKVLARHTQRRFYGWKTFTSCCLSVYILPTGSYLSLLKRGGGV